MGERHAWICREILEKHGLKISRATNVFLEFKFKKEAKGNGSDRKVKFGS